MRSWKKRQLIYASMGTLQNRLEHIFRIIAEACAGLDAQLVLALGRKGATAPANLPGHLLVVAYAPQTALLRRAALVITHGGLNTTLESLSEGLPLVVLPVANDQPGISARITYLGLGESIPLSKLTAANLRQRVNRVLTTPSYREQCAKIAEDIRRTNGPARAAELIEAAFASKQRIVRDQRV